MTQEKPPACIEGGNDTLPKVSGLERVSLGAISRLLGKDRYATGKQLEQNYRQQGN